MYECFKEKVKIYQNKIDKSSKTKISQRNMEKTKQQNALSNIVYFCIHYTKTILYFLQKPHKTFITPQTKHIKDHDVRMKVFCIVV